MENAATTDAHQAEQTPPARSFGEYQCIECAVVFTARSNRQTQFCCRAHQTAYQDRARIRGRILTTLLQAARQGKHPKNKEERDIAAFAFREMTALGDLYNQEDREAGRASPMLAVKSMMDRCHKPSIDRRR